MSYTFVLCRFQLIGFYGYRHRYKRFEYKRENCRFFFLIIGNHTGLTIWPIAWNKHFFCCHIISLFSLEQTIFDLLTNKNSKIIIITIPSQKKTALFCNGYWESYPVLFRSFTVNDRLFASSKAEQIAIFVAISSNHLLWWWFLNNVKEKKNKTHTIPAMT